MSQFPEIDGSPESDEALEDFDYEGVADFDDYDVQELDADEIGPPGDEQDRFDCPLYEIGRFEVLEDSIDRTRVFNGFLDKDGVEYSIDGITLIPNDFKSGTQIIILEPDVKSGRYKRTNYSF